MLIIKLTATSVATAEAATTAAETTATSSAASITTESATGLEAFTTSHLALHPGGSSTLSHGRTRHEEFGLTSLLRISVELVACFEALSLNALVRLDSEAGLRHGPEDIVNLADLVLVLQVNASHEKGHVAANHIANQHALASVRELCHNINVLGRTLLETYT